MSKYLQRGCYHCQEFTNPNTTYAKHVDDLIDKIRDHVWIDREMGPTALEIGCGEGLILLQLQLRLKWTVIGTDADQLAIGLAGRLNPTGTFYVNDFAPKLDIRRPDVILFCDSLEHIKAWRSHLEWAKDKARHAIVIAVPDRHDPHGEQDFKPDFADAILSGWEIAHRATRHARHLTIWKRPCAS